MPSCASSRASTCRRPTNGVEVGAEFGNWTAQLAISNGAGGGEETDHGKQFTTRVEFVQPRWRAGASLLLQRRRCR